jgi:hypothetical protein
MDYTTLLPSLPPPPEIFPYNPLQHTDESFKNHLDSKKKFEEWKEQATNWSKEKDKLDAYVLKAKEDIYKQTIKKMIYISLEKGTCTDNVLQKLYKQIPVEEGDAIITIGLNPDLFTDQGILAFWQRAIDMIDSQQYLFDMCTITLEQREETLDKPAHGWHIHIVAYARGKKDKLIDKLHKSFKRFVNGRNFVDFKYSENKNPANYLKGGKKPEYKIRRVERDKVEKVRLNIPFYLEKLSPNIIQQQEDGTQ